MLCNKGAIMRQVTRVTVALPSDLWESVKHAVPSGQRSSLVAEALESELRRRKRLQQIGQLHTFQNTMLVKYGELPTSASDIELMRQENDDERDGLR
jgi:metal-responsive CopG/Arc/MetJ family transcriptional regulator